VQSEIEWLEPFWQIEMARNKQDVVPDTGQIGCIKK